MSDPDRFRVLDVGFGDGEWMMHMSYAYPDADITGIDLVPAPEPRRFDVYPNVSPISPVDFNNEMWPVRENRQDLVHLGLLYGSVPSFARLYQIAHK